MFQCLKCLHVKMTNRGFTLLEALVYIGILGIIVSTIIAYFLWSIRASTKAQVMVETLDNARRVMEIMVSEIKEAQSLYTPTSVFDTHPGQLSLQTPKYVPAGEGTTTYIDFYISNGRLCLKKESQNPICLSSDRVEVKNFVLREIRTGTIASLQIDLEIDYKDTIGRPEYQASVSLQSVASLRSY